MIGQLTSLLEQLDALQARAIEQLETIETSAELEEWDTTYLGRKRGELTSISSVMGKLSKDERPLTCRMCRFRGRRSPSSCSPITLSTALWRPTSSRSETSSPSGVNNPAA